ncbi:interleukin-12 subunit alpha [Ictalurus furcatus]|uniref:interleukin-12 subunit alpha n=1 Tax=Ictalurus furcatus TaxID=66913 RepID=UPI002350EC8B|nr:interleukin-12 subunit alpha [Ictalurus furcatus]
MLVVNIILCNLTQPEKMGSNILFHGFNCTDLEVVVNPNTQTASVCQPSQVGTPVDSLISTGLSDLILSLLLLLLVFSFFFFFFFFCNTQCLQNIAKDLDYHGSMLAEYVSTLDQKANSESVKELNSITDSIRNLRQRSQRRFYKNKIWKSLRGKYLLKAINLSIYSFVVIYNVFPHQSCKLLPNTESSKDKWNSTNSFEDRKDLCKQLKGFQVRTITINRALGYICAGEYKK